MLIKYYFGMEKQTRHNIDKYSGICLVNVQSQALEASCLFPLFWLNVRDALFDHLFFANNFQHNNASFSYS